MVLNLLKNELMLIVRILGFILRLNRKKTKGSLFPEEEFIGYESFTSNYQDKTPKNNQNGIKIHGRR